MSEFNKKYNEIVKKLQDNIKDENERKIAQECIADLSLMFLDIIDRVTYISEEKISGIENKQSALESKLSEIENSVDGIENDIYDEDGYEFEIVCPCCNHEFIADFQNESEIKEQVECPKCHNMIELDWEDEAEGCTGNCSHCHDIDIFAEDSEEYNNQDEEDDDM